MEQRLCLSCKGTTYKFNYNSLKYGSERCNCCRDGYVPKDSNDDDFGPFDFKQHLRTTDITRKNRIVGHTVDLHDDRMSVDDATINLRGSFSVGDLEAMCSMMRRIKAAGKTITCECCQWGRFKNLVDKDWWKREYDDNKYDVEIESVEFSLTKE